MIKERVKDKRKTNDPPIYPNVSNKNAPKKEVEGDDA
jgi:hypothetical protein